MGVLYFIWKRYKVRVLGGLARLWRGVEPQRDQRELKANVRTSRLALTQDKDLETRSHRDLQGRRQSRGQGRGHRPESSLLLWGRCAG